MSCYQRIVRLETICAYDKRLISKKLNYLLITQRRQDIVAICLNSCPIVAHKAAYYAFLILNLCAHTDCRCKQFFLSARLDN